MHRLRARAVAVRPDRGANAEFPAPPLARIAANARRVRHPEAIKRASQTMTVEEVMRQIRQDALYYRYSGGGVTFSGGEALCQRDFVSELADACRSEGLEETAIETNLCHPFEKIAPVLKKMSLVMADIKIRMKRSTGSGRGFPTR